MRETPQSKAPDFAREQGISQQVMRADLDALRELGAGIESAETKAGDGQKFVQRYANRRAVFSEWIKKANG